MPYILCWVDSARIQFSQWRIVWYHLCQGLWSLYFHWLHVHCASVQLLHGCVLSECLEQVYTAFTIVNVFNPMFSSVREPLCASPPTMCFKNTVVSRLHQDRSITLIVAFTVSILSIAWPTELLLLAASCLSSDQLSSSKLVFCSEAAHCTSTANVIFIQVQWTSA